MAVRRTESRLPPGYDAFELGEAIEETKAVTIAGGNIEVRFALISYLTSPIAVGSKIDFVLFVENVPESDRDSWEYNWKTKRISTNEIIEKEDGKEEGTFSVKPDFIGEIITSVEIVRDDVLVTTLNIVQEIVALDPILEMFFGNEGMVGHLGVDKSIGSLGGDEGPSRELINNFRNYVFEAIKPAPPPPLAPKPDIDIPPRFLAALAYPLITRRPKDKWVGKDRDDIIEDVADDLNDDPEKVKKLGFSEGIGVCAVLPQMLAMVLKKPGTDSPFTPWIEAKNLDERRQKYKEIMETLNNLADASNVKVDIFNLIRFPKSNLRTCAIYLRKLIDRAHRWENITGNELLANENALALIATEFNSGATELEVGPVAIGDFGIKVVKYMKIPAIAIYFTDSTSEGASAYGGYDLQRDDNDDAHRWGGFDLVGPLQPGETSYVKALQEDLSALRFKIVGTADGGFGRLSEWAVREFQIYAKMPFVAKETDGGGSYIERLSRTVNVLPYTGPISGVVNLATRIAIQYWKANQWRCPVVIGAYDTNGNLYNNKENIWIHNEVGNCSPDVYVRDFTNYYGTSADDNNLIGMHAAIGDGPVSLRMNTCGHMRTHPQIEVTPERLIGVATSELLQSYVDPQTQEYYTKLRSTYKVVKSIAQAESVGYFDSINAWDTAIISVGMYHWTLGLRKSSVSVQRGESCVDEMCDGEMCAFLALLKMVDEGEFVKYFKHFGIDIDRNWWWVEESDGDLNASNSGDPFFMSSLFKYAGWIKRQTENGNFEEVDRKVNEANYFRNWHWFYRVTMANRNSNLIHRLNWLFTRMRIRDMLQLKWRRQDVPPVVPGAEFSLGDIYTSEKSIALLLRGHVNYPRKICFNGSISYTPASFNLLPQALQNAINSDATMNWNQSPSNWGDDEESALADHLLTILKNMYPTGTVPTFDTVNDFTWEGEVLSEKRNSFKFYDDELTSAPDYNV